MKTIFTLITITACMLIPFSPVLSQNCNYASGGNGISTALPSAITIDGNMADWAPYLNDPDNNSYDNTNGIDLDAPISDVGRDLTRFTFTENGTQLFLYLQRVGSVNNSVDILFYADINNNDFMDLREPVIHINWNGSNGNTFTDLYEYMPSNIPVENSLLNNLDGSFLKGTLQYRGSIGITGEGSADGRSVEVAIPFSFITTLGTNNAVLDQLQFGENFKFHVSTINGQVSNVPNGINDNFGGCLIAPTVVLPVKLASFTSTLNNNKAELKWTTASEINVSHFAVERSTDGENFSEVGIVFAYGNATENTNYSFSDNVSTVQSGIVYYRVRSVDIDGKSQYSETRIIRISKTYESNITIQAYPNPVINELRVSIPSSWQNKKVVYELFNANGQAAKKMETASSSQTETLNVNSLAPGFYFVRVSCNGETAQQKIIKQ